MFRLQEGNQRRRRRRRSRRRRRRRRGRRRRRRRGRRRRAWLLEDCGLLKAVLSDQLYAPTYYSILAVLM